MELLKTFASFQQSHNSTTTMWLLRNLEYLFFTDYQIGNNYAGLEVFWIRLSLNRDNLFLPASQPPFKVKGS